MFRPGDTIENPVTGERVVFTHTASETNGELVVVETYVQPGGFVAAAHMHPHQEERFEVREGRIGFRAAGKTLIAGPGDRVVVPERTPHEFWNAGPGEAQLVCEVRPALHFEELLATMYKLAADGKTNKKGMPNVLQLAVIAQAYSDTLRAPFPPPWVQSVALGISAPVGRLLGYRALVTDEPVPASRPRSFKPRQSPIQGA